MEAVTTTVIAKAAAIWILTCSILGEAPQPINSPPVVMDRPTFDAQARVVDSAGRICHGYGFRDVGVSRAAFGLSKISFELPSGDRLSAPARGEPVAVLEHERVDSAGGRLKAVCRCEIIERKLDGKAP